MNTPLGRVHNRENEAKLDFLLLVRAHFRPSVSVNTAKTAMMLAILFLLKTMESLQNGVANHFQQIFVLKLFLLYQEDTKSLKFLIQGTKKLLRSRFGSA